MTKTFDLSSLPYCTKDLRGYLQSLPTRDELLRSKKSSDYHQNLRRRLINYQRLLLSNYNRQSIRYNNKLYIDKQTFDSYGFSLLRSHPNVFIINEKRFNRALNSLDHRRNGLHNIQIHHTLAQLEPKLSLANIDHIKSHIKPIDTIIIKLNTCSTLIATGHGTAESIPSLHNTDIDQWKSNTIDEDVSLSRTCKKVSNRILLQRHIPSKSSTIHLFTTSNQIP